MQQPSELRSFGGGSARRYLAVMSDKP